MNLDQLPASQNVDDRRMWGDTSPPAILRTGLGPWLGGGLNNKWPWQAMGTAPQSTIDNFNQAPPPQAAQNIQQHPAFTMQNLQQQAGLPELVRRLMVMQQEQPPITSSVTQQQTLPFARGW